MIKNLIDKYKNHRKQQHLNYPTSYTKNFAFVGVGNHSISNLYPCLDYLAVPIKYICTRKPANAQKMAKRYGAKAIELNDLAADSSISGVFVCASPNSHFTICKTLLENGKSVFVEKPPCTSLKELDILQKLANQNELECVVGLQKRYAPIYNILKKNTYKNTLSYSFKYLTGAYPEGDALWDLFVHPLDILVFLFGGIENFELKTNQKGKNQTLFLLTEHQNGVVGQVELSTDYSWNQAKEELFVNTLNGNYQAEGLHKLTFTPKSASILGIPIEKIIKQNSKKEILYQVSDFVPISAHNSLFVQGYFQEIETFTQLVEGKRNKNNNKSSLKVIRATFKWIEDIENQLK